MSYVEKNLPNGGVITEWVSPPPIPTWANAPAEYFWINVGAYYDRFNGKAISLLSSTDVEVQAWIEMAKVREYIDLKRPELPYSLDVFVSKGLLNSADKAAILNPATTEYERHIKGLVQPIS